MGGLTRRIQLLEVDYEQTSSRLQSASEKLEEASKHAEDSEKYVSAKHAGSPECEQGSTPQRLIDYTKPSKGEIDPQTKSHRHPNQIFLYITPTHIFFVKECR